MRPQKRPEDHLTAIVVHLSSSITSSTACRHASAGALALHLGQAATGPDRPSSFAADSHTPCVVQARPHKRSRVITRAGPDGRSSPRLPQAHLCQDVAGQHLLSSISGFSARDGGDAEQDALQQRSLMQVGWYPACGSPAGLPRSSMERPSCLQHRPLMQARQLLGLCDKDKIVLRQHVAAISAAQQICSRRVQQEDPLACTGMWSLAQGCLSARDSCCSIYGWSRWTAQRC